MAKSNRSLKAAKAEKNDEFYTLMPTIEDEMEHYRQCFKGKVVLCNCDDPRMSNFFRYFSLKFESLGLKKLVTTCYKSRDADLFSRHDSESAVYLEYNGDKDGDRVPSADEIGVKPLAGDGDFRSKECVALLKKADIVVTNPPFSLFREYVAQLMSHKKQFIIIGNMNAITYKEIFPLIRDEKMWYGESPSGMEFRQPNTDELAKLGFAIWFTNLPNQRRNEELTLLKKYDPKSYPKYDNYDAIEVSKTADIPEDYRGVMGVPISFLNKHNPKQFKIVGMTQRGCHDNFPDTRKYDNYWEVRRADDVATGQSGHKTNENPVLRGIGGKKHYFTNGRRKVHSAYQRLFVELRSTQ